MTNKILLDFNIKAVNSNDRTVEGWASLPDIDRMGDIVIPEGAEYELPLPFLLDHDHSKAIGTVDRVEVTKKGIKFWAHIQKFEEEGEAKRLTDYAWDLVRSGLRSAVSIGFRALEFTHLNSGGIKFDRWEWYELSAVSIPAVAGAKITRVKSFNSGTEFISVFSDEVKTSSKEQGGALAKSPVRVVKTLTSGVSEKNQSAKIKPKEVSQMKTLKEQLKAYEDTLADKALRMKEMMEKSSEEGVTFDNAESEEYDGLEQETKALQSHITRLKNLVVENEKNVTPVEDKSKSVGTVYHVRPENEKLDKGIEFARFAMCQLASKGNPQMASSLAKSHFPKNERVVKTLEFIASGGNLGHMMKATVEAGTTLDPTWAAPLVDYQNFAGDFVEFLRPQTIIGQFGSNGIPALRSIPFNVRITGQTSGGNAYWVGEGAPKPLTSFDFTATELRWAKIATIAVITNELMRFGSPSAERLVRDALASAIVERADIDFVDPAKAAVANVSPASITNGATSFVSSGIDADSVRVDIQRLINVFIAARNPARNAVFIMDSTTALALSWFKNPLGQPEFTGIGVNGGTFMGYPVIVSDHLPVDSAGGMIVLANASDIWLADDGQVTIDASREASLQMLDNPTNNSATGTATSMVSMFQTNSTALLAERYINWARRRVSAVAYLTGVSYSGAV